jgi:ribonuclease P protein component
VVRSGTSARRGSVVVHRRRGLHDGQALVGFVVGRSVGTSVVRHRVSRRLRAQMARRLDRLDAGSGLVVRALPKSARASSVELGRDLDEALTRLDRAR